jgi:hypothetical protein
MAIHTCFECFIYFKYILQVFNMSVAKVDLVLHMLQGHCWLVDSGLP